MGTKRVVLEQNYEDYWKLTLEYSDIYSSKYNGTLRIIVDYIDKINISPNHKIFQEQYKELQNKVYNVYPKEDMGSVRKSINQFIKLGFIKYRLSGYHEKTKKFLNETNLERKKRLFSEIVYSSASFRSSVTEDSEEKEINFFIKTLENNKSLDIDEVLGIILTLPSEYPKGYLNEDELNEMTRLAKEIRFRERKYNQLRYVIDVLKKLEGVQEYNGKFYLEETFIEDELRVETRKVRDNYLQRLYKNQLKQESKELFGEVVCMISKVPYYAMIASHIKPFIDSSPKEEYDSQNGLLLGKDLDFLFDQGYISIDNSGQIILCSDIREKIVKYHKLRGLYLDNRLLTNERKNYLNYHRNFIFKK